MRTCFKSILLSAFLCLSTFGQITVIPVTNSGTGGGGSGQYSTASASYTTLQGTYWFPAGGGQAASTTEGPVKTLQASAGTIQNLAVTLSANASTSTLAFVFRQNGNSTTLTCSITGSNSTCADTTHSFQQAVNDLTDIQVTVSGANYTGAVIITWATPGVAGPQGPTGPAGSGASAANTLTDISPVRTSATVATGTFATNGTVFGQPGYSTALTGTFTIALASGAAPSATTFYIYQDPTAPTSLKVDTTGSFTNVTLSGITQGNASATGYLADTTLLYRLTAGNSTPNQWDAWSSCAPNATTGCIDDRGWLGKTVVKVGTDLTSSVTNGVKTLNADNTILAQKFFGTAAPGSVAGNLPGDLYSDTTNHNIYQCNAVAGTAAPACTSVASGAWTQLNGGGTSVSANSPFLLTIGGTNYVTPYMVQQSAFSTAGFSAKAGSPTTTTIGGITGVVSDGTTTYNLYGASISTDTTIIGGEECNLGGVNVGCGIYISEAASSNMYWVGVSLSASAPGGPQLAVVKGTTAGGFTSLEASVTVINPAPGPWFFKITVGTNVVFSVSWDGGKTYTQLFSATKASLFTSAPDTMGIVVTGGGTPTAEVVYWSAS